MSPTEHKHLENIADDADVPRGLRGSSGSVTAVQTMPIHIIIIGIISGDGLAIQFLILHGHTHTHVHATHIQHITWRHT